MQACIHGKHFSSATKLRRRRADGKGAADGALHIGGTGMSSPVGRVSGRASERASVDAIGTVALVQRPLATGEQGTLEMRVK